MENPAVKRIITLIDMDCFYCQVELRLNPSLAGKPMAVVLYNQWKQGGIIAVNYEARDRGVTRFMRGEEAKKVCPEIELASVPSVRGKADLTRYRDAGVEVAEVFSEFSDLVLRASVDEAFIDLTSAVEKRIKEGDVQLDPDKLPSTFVVGYSSLKGNDSEDRLKGTLQWLKTLLRNKDKNNPDYRLCVGAMIVEDIRKEVLKRTGFHCSAGIAHNKILAKLVAGVHKPKCQTVVSHENVPELFETMPLRKVRNLGGKFGKTVGETLKISNMSELYQFSKEDLIAKFGMKNGVWLYDIARGVDHEPVTSRMIAESIGCSKNFRGPVAITTKEKLLHWLTDMATEVVERLEKDQVENSRKAQSLVVSFKFGATTGSRTCSLPGYKAEAIAKEAFDVLMKMNQAPHESLLVEPPIEFLGLSTSKFISVKSNIKSFLKDKSNASNKETPDQRKNESVDQSKNIQPISTVTIVDDKPILDKENMTENERIDTLFPPERELVTLEKLSNVLENASSDTSAKTGNNKDEEKTLRDGKPANYSFFATFLAKRAKTEEKPESPISKTSVESSSPPQPGPSRLLDVEENSCASTESQDTQDDWFQLCPDCHQKIHLSEYFEHLDYHTALKLDKDINKIQVKTAPPQIKQEAFKLKKSPLKKKRKVIGPDHKKAITNFFTTVPK